MNLARVHRNQTFQQLEAILLAMTVAGMVGACSHRSPSFVDQSYEFYQIEKVAVLPFENNSTDLQAAERIRLMTITEFLSRQVFQVIDPGIVNQGLTDLKFHSTASLTPEELKGVGEKLGVKTVVAGSVNNYKLGSYSGVTGPEVTLTIRMLDTETGQIVFMTTLTTKAPGFAARAFGATTPGVDEAAQELVARACDQLFRAKRVRTR